MAYKGKFKPKNPSKYIGDPTNIWYRSRWELMFMQKADTHPEIKRWASEEISIPYVSPKDGKIHRYYPDFYIETEKSDGERHKFLIEIKPKKQTIKPKQPEKLTQRSRVRYMTESMTYVTNMAKWKAAKNWCNDKGLKFLIMTEDELGIKF